MAYVVTDKCIRCKYTDCVVVCPVACFHEGENMLVINPFECIDCGVCVAQCPANAIVSDLDPQGEKWLDFNRRYAQKWPRIKEQKAPLPQADEWKDTPNKMDLFSENPGS
jgi:ferredoxin